MNYFDFYLKKGQNVELSGNSSIETISGISIEEVIGKGNFGAVYRGKVTSIPFCFEYKFVVY